MTDPESRRDPWKEALECYEDLADEIVITGDNWKYDFSWEQIGKFFQEGFYAKAGMHSWDFSSTVTASLGSSKDALGSGTDPFFGIGFGSEHMELGYEYYKIEDGDISALTLRYAIQF